MRYVCKKLCAAGMLILLGCCSACMAGSTEGDDELGAALLSAVIHNDMFYGADDYFGDHRDLVYVDRVEPTPVGAEQSETASNPEASSGAGGTSPDDGNAEVSGDDSLAGDPAPGDGSEDDDTPVAPPVDPPADDDGPADDIADDISDDVGGDIGDDGGGGG